MKVSVSLPGDDVQFLDDYAREQGMASRSAAVHHAIGMLRVAELMAEYESAWGEWESTDEAETWESATADGLAS